MKLTFDIGGSQSRLALVDERGLGEVRRFVTDGSLHGPGKLAEQIAEAVRGQRVTAAVGCLPVQLDQNGVIQLARNLPAWQGVHVADLLAKAAGCPVELHNDIELCGLGEAWYGAGIKRGTMAYLTVSTGVNGVRIIDGEIDTTIGWFEVGFQVVGNGLDAACDAEGLIGGASLQRRFGAPPKELRDPVLWDQEAQYLARVILNTWLYWTPEVIVLGGSMMRDIELVAVQKHFDALLRPNGRSVELRLSTMDDTRGLLGARVLLERHSRKDPDYANV